MLQAINQSATAKPEQHLVELRTHLLALGKAENQIKDLREHVVDGTSNTEHSIIEVLELWQQIFRDTFKQYHRLSTRLVQSEDSASALRLWHDYLLHVQSFLSDALPDDYSSLNETRHLCEMHRNLLTSQKSVLSSRTDDGSPNVDPVLVDKFNTFSNLHNETLTQIIDRHAEIDARLRAWNAYKNDQAHLLEWLKNKEREKSRLQLRYIHLRRIPHTLQSIETLVGQIGQAEKDSDNLRKQQAQLMSFCKNNAIVTSMRMEHGAIAQRIENLRAALETWKDFLTRIITLGKSYNQKVTELQAQFQQIQSIVTDTSRDMPHTAVEVENCLAQLRDQRVLLSNLTPELESITVIQEELKECLSPGDMKAIRRMVRFFGFAINSNVLLNRLIFSM